MKKLTSSAAALLLVACAQTTPVKEGEASLPPVSPSPTEEVVVEKLEDELKEENVTVNARSRARKLFEILLGGVNR